MMNIKMFPSSSLVVSAVSSIASGFFPKTESRHSQGSWLPYCVPSPLALPYSEMRNSLSIQEEFPLILPLDLLESLKLEANVQKIPFSHLIIDILRRYLWLINIGDKFRIIIEGEGHVYELKIR